MAAYATIDEKETVSWATTIYKNSLSHLVNEKLCRVLKHPTKRQQRTNEATTQVQHPYGELNIRTRRGDATQKTETSQLQNSLSAMT